MASETRKDKGDDSSVVNSQLPTVNSSLILYQRKLAALDELKKSLLHRAFSGQL